RNLVINAVDAIEKWKAGRIKLEISKEKKDDEEIYVFEVTDNGSGIKKEDIGVIFETGYSTKFDSKTGNISRGIGLTVVKDLINNVFRGNIEVFSEVNKYTTFRVSIPKEIFEGEVY
ncbi:MAG: ATP-binding protein, partial [Anaerovoracaceae bacterium]